MERLEHERNYDIVLPEESIGACRNCRNCKHYKVALGNGYCIKCWDRGMERQDQNHKQKETVSR